jgi:hypothetical protein
MQKLNLKDAGAYRLSNWARRILIGVRSNRHILRSEEVRRLEFKITCGRCGENAIFKNGDSKSIGEIDLIVPWESSKVQIWCDKCNDFIEIE